MVSNLVWERMATHSHDYLIFSPQALGIWKNIPMKESWGTQESCWYLRLAICYGWILSLSVKRIFLGKAFIFVFYWWMFVYKTGHPLLKILPAFPFFLCLTGNKRNPQNVHSSCRNAACWKTLARSIKVSCYLRNVKVTVHWLLYWYCEEKLCLGRSWEVKGKGIFP